MTSMPSLDLAELRRCRRRSPRLAPIAAYVLSCLLWAASAFCETIDYETPEWRKEIAHGFLPYHRLVRADFPIDDKAHPRYAMYTYGFYHYNYEPKCTKEGGHVVARITEWRVRSGFNRNKSSRKSWFKDVERLVIHEQGHLDINELHSRRLAHMELEDLPVGKGETSREALEDLRKKVMELSDESSKENQTEQDAYDAETSHGKDRSRQLAVTAALHERLKAAGITYANRSDDDQTDTKTEEDQSSALELLGRTLKKER